MKQKNRKISLLVIRIILGGVFLLSSVGKLIDSGYVNYDLIRLLATKFYWLIEYAKPIVLTISTVELILALLFFWGRYLRYTLTVALLMLLFFSGILGYFYIQGMNVASCGCFGALGIGGGLTFSLIKNVVLIALIIAAYFLMPSTRRQTLRY